MAVLAVCISIALVVSRAVYLNTASSGTLPVLISRTIRIQGTDIGTGACDKNTAVALARPVHSPAIGVNCAFVGAWAVNLHAGSTLAGKMMLAISIGGTSIRARASNLHTEYPLAGKMMLAISIDGTSIHARASNRDTRSTQAGLMS
jgi:hypothetical protein